MNDRCTRTVLMEKWPSKLKIQLSIYMYGHWYEKLEFQILNVRPLYGIDFYFEIIYGEHKGKHVFPEHATVIN